MADLFVCTRSIILIVDDGSHEKEGVDKYKTLKNLVNISRSPFSALDFYVLDNRVQSAFNSQAAAPSLPSITDLQIWSILHLKETFLKKNENFNRTLQTRQLYIELFEKTKFNSFPDRQRYLKGRV